MTCNQSSIGIFAPGSPRIRRASIDRWESLETFGRPLGGVGRPAPNIPPIEDRHNMSHRARGDAIAAAGSHLIADGHFRNAANGSDFTRFAPIGHPMRDMGP